MSIDVATLTRELHAAGFAPRQSAALADIAKIIVELATGTARTQPERAAEYYIALFAQIAASDAAQQLKALDEQLEALRERAEQLEAILAEKAEKTSGETLTGNATPFVIWAGVIVAVAGAYRFCMASCRRRET